MKGLTVERAGASNAIDVFPLLRQAAKEGAFTDTPSDLQLQRYFYALTGLLTQPNHFFYLARRGRGFLGVLHAIVVPGRWDGTPDTVYIDMLYVVEKRRKMGVGKKLLDQLAKDAEEIGIKKFEFLAKDELVDYWCKKRKAQKISNLMRVVV
jgi:GNAT superfamily N-acetyltransferase